MKEQNKRIKSIRKRGQRILAALLALCGENHDGKYDRTCSGACGGAEGGSSGTGRERWERLYVV